MPTPSTPAWWVETQRETTEVNGAGRLTTGVEITYSTRAGHTGTLFITDTDYQDLAKVKAAIGAAAEHSDAIGSLSADSTAGD